MRRIQRTKSISVLAILILFAASIFAQTSPQRRVVKVLPPPTPCPAPHFNPFLLRNLLQNPSFNTVGPSGVSTTWQGAMPYPFPPSAAANWGAHNSNSGAVIATNMIASTGPQGPRMLHIKTGGNEGGVIQNFSSLHKGQRKIIGAVWVFVKRGNVQLGIHADGAPTASVMSTKVGQWELLQVCSEGNAANSMLFIINQDPQGGEFFIDAAAVVKSQ